MSKVRLKFVVAEHARQVSNVSDGQGGWKPSEVGTVVLRPVTGGSEENKQFYAWSPSGEFKFGTINKAALEALPLGAEVYIDIELATAVGG